MLVQVDPAPPTQATHAVLHRIEALPGDGRYALTFRRADGGEQAVVVQIPQPDGADPADPLDVAESSLPPGWTRRDVAFAEMVTAVLALERSRAATRPTAGVLRDLEGGWDVSLGNVVLDLYGAPWCIAHGEMTAAGTVWTCPECGAQARFG
jgi:hypothetical protein